MTRPYHDTSGYAELKAALAGTLLQRGILETFVPCRRTLEPCTAETCTNTSGVIKPKPLSSLKNLIVPVAIC